MVIAQNSQTILFNLYDEGMASCFDSVCTAFWIAFENAGEQNIENSLASCEAGDPNFQCTNN